MSVDDAKSRITLSEIRLQHLLELGAASQIQETIQTVDREVFTLEKIAEQHPDLSSKVGRLVAEWLLFRRNTRLRIH